MTPLAQLLTAPTADQVRAFFVDGLETLGVPASAWKKGGAFSSILTIFSRWSAAVMTSLVTSVLSAPFLPISPLPWLAIIAQYVYGVTPNVATFASGSVLLTNPGGVTYTVKIGQLSVGNSFTGQVYTNTVPFALGPLSTSAPIAIQANRKGSVGNATAGPGAGSIDTVVSAGLFPGVAVTVTNPLPVIGLDGDPPEVIRTKCLVSIAARSYKGPNGAYQNAVLTAVNGLGNPVNVNRWSVVRDPATGAITVYLASPGGVPVAGDIDAVQDNIIQVAEPQGITATAVACTVVPLHAVATQVTVWALGAGVVPPEDILAGVLASLDAALAIYPISGLTKPPATQGFIFASFLDGIVKAGHPLIYDVDGFTADIPLSAGQVAERTATTNITIRQTVTP